MAVVDRAALEQSALSSGDFVRIDGPGGGTAVARVWPSDAEDAGRGIVRIDGQLRQAAGAGVDDSVELSETATLDDIELGMDAFEDALAEVEPRSSDQTGDGQAMLGDLAESD